ncbi:hypothetical protein HO173_013343 [Letharia columbiana]|uniref:Uncharacterized protein n=1 Tax=Letharia columbiana TaxID=112416 RepID=A0A8H6CGQ5_9LECA|nr:uncharacterized protein HO173_013343 [Letharia columbiana]KAF6223073.1 hypothetical protein HO173_013343 [Letharia columbiana]
MYLLIVFLALCFCQSVSSVPENDVPSANSTKALFKRVDNPTYAIDGTCTRYPQVQDIVNDWFQTVQVTSHRISLGGADPHFQHAFQVLFNTDPNSNTLYDLQLVEEPITAYDFVEFVTTSLASLTPHADPDTKANLIFYCDDDAMNPTPYSNERWQLRPDIRGDPNPNSGRTLGINQEWFDQVNFITRSPITLGCKAEPTELETWRET